MKKTGLYMASTALVAVLLGGCATMLEGSIKETDIKIVGSEKARCVIYNDDYKYLVNAPARVPLERSHKDLTADCYGESGKHRVVTIPSIGSSAAAVNAMNGVVPGVAVDVTSGAAFTFPDEVVIDFDREPNALARAQAYRANRPQWPNNMVDGMYMKLPPEPEVVEPEVVYVEVTPPEEPIEPMKAIELLHKKMNHLPGDEPAVTGLEITESGDKPVVVVVEGADAVVVPADAAPAKMAPIVEGAERTMAQPTHGAAQAAPMETAPAAEEQPADAQSPAADENAAAAPAGNSAALEPVTPVGGSYSAPMEINENAQPIHNVQMDPVMDEPEQPKAAAKAAAPAEEAPQPAAEETAPAEDEEQGPPPLGAEGLEDSSPAAPGAIEDPSEMDSDTSPDFNTPSEPMKGTPDDVPPGEGMQEEPTP